MKQGYRLSMIMRLLAIGISSVGTLFLLPLVLRTLGEYDFGIWGMVSAITGYLLLLDFGIALACTRYLSVSGNDKTRWTGIMTNSLLLATGIAGLMLIVVVGLWLLQQQDFLPADQQRLLTIISILIIEVALSIPLRLYTSILRTEVRYVDIGLFEVIRVCLRIGSISLALLYGADLVDIVLLASLVNLLFFLLPVLSVYRRHQHWFIDSKTLDKTSLKNLLNFSKFTAVSQAAEFLKFRTDAVLVGLLLGITVSAHYTIIVFIVMMLVQVLMRFLSYWDTIIIRQIGEHDTKAALQTVASSMAIGTGISLLAILNSVVFGGTFITLWMGPQYAFLQNNLILLCLVSFGISIQMATTPYFNAIGQEKANARLDLTEVLLKLALIYPLSTLAGLQGFIIAIIAASVAISGVARLLLLRRHSGQSLSLLIRPVWQKLAIILPTTLTLLTLYLMGRAWLTDNPYLLQGIFLTIELCVAAAYLFQKSSKASQRSVAI